MRPFRSDRRLFFERSFDAACAASVGAGIAVLVALFAIMLFDMWRWLIEKAFTDTSWSASFLVYVGFAGAVVGAWSVLGRRDK